MDGDCASAAAKSSAFSAEERWGTMLCEIACRNVHLAPYKEDYARDTIAAMRDMNIDYIIPLHCTYEPFYGMVKAEMPNKLLRSYTGTRFVFSA
jgi:metal-dependent hydrolase (beta-lactamase superfamily II)